ncbi:MAG TPA: phosphoesterase [Phycisphaerales bacterium]|nr:phosphoesterase [Phycisphaerales bacterium]
MRRFVDLHAHSTASDGQVTPEELIRLAEARRLAAVALTDHDTIDGLAPARAEAAKFPALRFVPGIEISAEPPSGTLHILGLGIDERSAPVRAVAQFLRSARDARNPKIVAKLVAMGVGIDMDDVRAAAGAVGSEGEVLGRLHIAEALRRKGVVRDTAEAFQRYLARGAAAYVERQRPSPAEAIAAIRDSGGLAVLAHPVQLGCGNRAQLERLVRQFLRHGLEGIEVYHTDHDAAMTRRCLDLARKYGLCVTGGSDFHGAAKPDARLGRPRVPLAAIDARFAERLFGAS